MSGVPMPTDAQPTHFKSVNESCYWSAHFKSVEGPRRFAKHKADSITLLATHPDTINSNTHPNKADRRTDGKLLVPLVCFLFMLVLTYYFFFKYLQLMIGITFLATHPDANNSNTHPTADRWTDGKLLVCFLYMYLTILWCTNLWLFLNICTNLLLFL